MKKRKLGKTDIMVSELAFGAWAIGGWMWGGTDSKEAVRAMETAIDNGMTTIDTASVYGFGLSEELTGKAIRGKRDKVQVLTKFGMEWKQKNGEFFFESQDNSGNSLSIYKFSSKEKVINDCDESLRRLRTDYIDLFQIHWPDSTTPVSETMEALEILVTKGKIRAGGVCNFSAELMLEANGTFSIASNQLPYSMLKRDIEEDVVPAAVEKEISILAYSPLQRGLLTGKIKPGHHFEEGDTRPSSLYYKEPNLSNILTFLERLKPLAEEHNASLAQLVLNWTSRQRGITCVLAGARNPVQVIDNLSAAKFVLSDDEIQKINNYISELSIDTKI
ncbi:MAG TPA: aldo/keto reductase [Bacteroidales bacterium]|nr:aldo/keto reductase [Bacteroidales bacterium]HPR11726.1 aldo/keto reductase [Bacteroidales bacterium]